MLKYFVKTLASIVIIAVAITGCKKSIDKNSTNDDNPFGGTAIVKTLQPSDIHLTSAKCGAELVVTEGHVFAYEIGICWGTEPNPDTSNHHYSTSQWDEQYYHVITDLEPETEYYVRAYAGYNGGYHYGEDVTFSTLSADLPVVETAPVTSIGPKTAVCGGNVISEGGSPVTQRGVSFGYQPDLLIFDTYDGEGLGEFVSNVAVSNWNTTYYIRAYAVNEAGKAYGQQLTFRTTQPEEPTGAIPGLFYISNRGYVWFSKGNLQYEESTDTWRFAEHQWDTIGAANLNSSPNYNGWKDLFKGITTPGLHEVINGGDLYWEEPYHSDWQFLIERRHTQTGLRYAKGQVNGINGLLLLPDAWDTIYYKLYSPNTPDASFATNIIDLNSWNTILEPNGVVFLPAAGMRYQNDQVIKHVNSSGIYWSSTGTLDSHKHYALTFYDTHCTPNDKVNIHNYVSKRYFTIMHEVY